MVKFIQAFPELINGVLGSAVLLVLWFLKRDAARLEESLKGLDSSIKENTRTTLENSKIIAEHRIEIGHLKALRKDVDHVRQMFLEKML